MGLLLVEAMSARIVTPPSATPQCIKSPPRRNRHPMRAIHGTLRVRLRSMSSRSGCSARHSARIGHRVRGVSS
jgi:hypothetical protein